MVNGATGVNNVVVSFGDGRVVAGFVQRITEDPNVFAICKHTTSSRNEEAIVFVDLRKVTKLIVDHGRGEEVYE